MSVKHTPGPLKALKGHDDEPDRWTVVADGEMMYLVAVIENGQPGDFCETEGATARLFAAAPELLVVLKEFVAADECAVKEMATYYVPPPEYVAMHEKARAAIAKATQPAAPNVVPSLSPEAAAAASSILKVVKASPRKKTDKKGDK